MSIEPGPQLIEPNDTASQMLDKVFGRVMNGYARNANNTKHVIKLRQATDIFLDKILKLSNLKTINEIIMDIQRTKIQERIKHG